MNTKKIATLLGTVTATVCLISAMGQAANASTFYNDWHYAIDPPSDGNLSDSYPQNSIYELYGIAIKHDAEADKVYVAINSDFPIEGDRDDPEGQFSRYEWGDFFFNFSDLSSLDNAQGSLLAVRFGEYAESIDGTENSGVGVYSNVTAKTSYQTLFDSLEYYNIAVYGNGSMADLAINDPYWFDAQGNDPILNVIDSGQYIPRSESGFESLNATELTNIGLDFGGVLTETGRETFGFSFNKDLLPSERYIAHVFETCGNDGAAIAVPEPSTMVGLFGLGLTVLGSQISKRRKGNGVS
ncbi:MAG: PEP-CTERM sorting domain-containing protein [Coleofasciculus sp. B1-GNL1-01]|uniref:PEP-CTERM sorting domain-containing protein n=1 Tax=Coleofasciculus sp. B1-GNL1-01 TaxID=3068484 RepID=UPI0032F9DEAC